MMRAIAALSLLSIAGIGADPVGVCPSTNGAYVDFLVDDKDCNKFYKCDWGKPVLYTCPSDLHFNSKLNVCDWPENAECSGSAGPTTGTSIPTTQPDSTPNSGSCESVTCPYTPGKYPVFHAHPEDCGRYCKCDNYGTVHDMPCPAGLYFNTELNVCDWPENVGCNGGPITTPKPTTTDETTTTEKTTPAPPMPTTQTTTITTPKPGDCASVTCPYTPGQYPVFHAHPKDCGRYCKCDNYGTVHDMPCPAGLHFNTDLNVCDWPENAGCNGGSTTTPKTTTTEKTTPAPPTPTTQTPTITTPKPGDCASVSCPYTPGPYPVFHAHSKDCGRYCKCDNYGTVHDMPCPTGLHFNTELNVCDWPEDAGCNGAPLPTTTQKPDPTTDDVLPDDTTTTSTQTPVTSPVPGDDCSSVVCPSQNGDFPVFHSHPKVCDRYCKCDWGVAYDMPCPDGLHFNPVLNVCDYPVDAKCPHA
nr:probable chitinase 10 [Onthophagus taurus]